MAKPDDIEVRNPRYAGAKTPGDLVRALMRPTHPRVQKPSAAKKRRVPPSKREGPG